MEEKNINKKYTPRRTPMDILQMMSTYDSTRMSVNQFCIMHNISATNFHKWMARYQEESQNGNAAFARLHIKDGFSNEQSMLFAKVNGIYIYQAVPASYLKELCR